MKNKVWINEKVVFNGYDGWQHDEICYRLAVGGQLAETINGDLICSWLSGSDREPANDNCLLASRSSDGGVSWSEPSVLVPSGTEAGAGCILPHVVPGGKLVGMFASWPPECGYNVWHYTRYEFDDNGYTWGSPRPIELIAGVGVSASIGGLTHLSDGRILLCGTFYKKREYCLTASLVDLAYSKNEADAFALNGSSINNDRPTFRTHLNGIVVFESNQQLNNFRLISMIANRPLGLLEPTMIELKDGRITILARAECGGFLWRMDSEDGGNTFCNAWQTDIPNPTTMSTIARMGDGRIMLIHNNTGGVLGYTSKRDPLSIWISDDEIQSFYIKEDVMHGGSFAYPNLLKLCDDRMVFGFDYNRRMVKLIEVLVL